MTGACQAHSTGAVLYRYLLPSSQDQQKQTYQQGTWAANTASTTIWLPLHAILRTALARLGFQLQLQAKTGLPSDWQAAA